MRAIISDVHSNIEALQAVLADIAQQGAEEILCLGDVVGYGPDPEECIDLIEKMCRFCLSGNHDYAVLTRAERFNPLAEEAVDYTRSVLKPRRFRSAARRRAGGSSSRCRRASPKATSSTSTARRATTATSTSSRATSSSAWSTRSGRFSR